MAIMPFKNKDMFDILLTKYCWYTIAVFKSIKPGSKCLFQGIKSFCKLAHMMRFWCIKKTLRLGHIYIIFKKPIEESTIHVNLSNNPPLFYNQTKNNSNSGSFNKCTESLIIIHALSLSKTLGYKSGLLYKNRAIWVIFNYKYPFIAYNLHRWRRLN